jgi:nucleoside-diphosphate-sugar epimerase
MTMPDAVAALIRLARADRSDLSQWVYNITAFNPSAEEIRELVLAGFPDARINFEPDLKRQAILDTWPADVDDSAARRDWGLDPQHDLARAFDEYLMPGIRDRYRDG